MVSIFKGGTETEGDVNGDGTVNISDVTTLVNMILGKTSSVATKVRLIYSGGTHIEYDGANRGGALQ